MIGKRNSKKGLTPVIAVILLLMMTVSAAGAAFFWFVRVQGELQGGSEQFSQELSKKVASGIEVVLTEYQPYFNYSNATNNSGASCLFGNITFILKNTGATKISLRNTSTSPTTTWILQDSEQDMICSEDWNAAPSNCILGCGGDLGISSRQTVTLNLSGVCDIGNATTYPNGTIFYYKVDFSGQTATGGSFRKK